MDCLGRMHFVCSRILQKLSEQEFAFCRTKSSSIMQLAAVCRVAGIDTDVSVVGLRRADAGDLFVLLDMRVKAGLVKRRLTVAALSRRKTAGPDGSRSSRVFLKRGG